MEAEKRKVNVVMLFQKTGLESHDSAVDPEQLRSVVVGLYFSAHWCAQSLMRLPQATCALMIRSGDFLYCLYSLLTSPAGVHHAGSSPLC